MDSVSVATSVAPSKICTVPVGVGAPAEDGHAAINTPRRTSPVAAVTLLSSVVVVAIDTGRGGTTTTSAVDVLGA